MKIQIFCAVFNSSNSAGREKNKSNYGFHSIVKNNGKEGLTLLKVRREKSLAQIFRKLSKFTISDLKSKYVFYPN